MEDQVLKARSVFSANLRELLKRNGLSQQAFAESIGIKHQSVSYFLRENALPSVETLLKISKTYGLSLDYLLLGHENKETVFPQWLELSAVPLIDDIIRYIQRPEETGFLALDADGQLTISEVKQGNYTESAEAVADVLALQEVKKDLEKLRLRYWEMITQEFSQNGKDG